MGKRAERKHPDKEGQQEIKVAKNLKSQFAKGTSGNPGGRKRYPTFADILKEVLNKQRTYRKADGTLLTTTEMTLIVSRAVKELRTGFKFDVKLFETIMNRVDGKAKETIDVDGIKELAHDLSAHDIILSRINGIINARGTDKTDKLADAGGSISDTVPMVTVEKN